MLFVSIFACLPYKLPDPRLSFIACILTPCISSGNPTTAPFENRHYSPAALCIQHLLQQLSHFLAFSGTWFTFPSLEAWQPSSVGSSIFFTPLIPLCSMCPVCLLSHSVMFDSSQCHGLQAARLLCPWNFPARILERVTISYSRSLFAYPVLITVSTPFSQLSL